MAEGKVECLVSPHRAQDCVDCLPAYGERCALE